MVTIVIPAYNEEKKIDKVIEQLKKEGYHSIIVVNDGSKDDTALKAKGAGAHVLNHNINRGQGAALQTGIEYALEKGAEIIVTFDADGQHNAQEVKRMTEPIKRGEVEVTLGSRFLKNTHNAPFGRRIILKGGAFLMRIFYGIKLTDTHNGFRAFSSSAAKTINLKCDGMAHASEIIEQISMNKLRFKEVPVTIKYTDYSTQRGQKNSSAFVILFKMIMNKFMR